MDDRCGQCKMQLENQMKMLLTRIGNRRGGWRAGDLDQTDRPSRRGLSDLLMVEQKRKSDGINTVNFNHMDVVRHKVMNDFRPLRLIFSD